MPDEKNSVTLRVTRLLQSVFGQGLAISRPNEIKKLDLNSSNTLSISEMDILRRNKSDSGGMRSSNSVRSDLMSVSSKIAKHAEEHASYKAMVPEIKKTRAVIIPSLLSPSDMYGEDLTVTVDCESIDESVALKISDILTTLANKKLHLGSKLSEWIGDALFENGATPVMVIPKQIVKILAGIQDTEKQPSTESHDSKKPNKNKSWPTIQKVALSTKPATDDKTKNSSTPKNNEGYVTSESLINVVYGMGDFTIESSKPNGVKKKSKMSDYYKSIEEELEKNGENAIVKKTNDALSQVKPFITFSHDYREIKLLSDKINKVKDEASKLMDGLVSTISGDKILSISDSPVSENDEPLIHRLPATSVIPVFVPGSPSSHLGYFVLVDEWGNPINKIDRPSMDKTTKSLPFIASLDSIVGINNLDSQRQQGLVSMLFELTIKKMIEDETSKYGIDKGAIPKTSAIYSCLFHKALHKEKIKLIYVPVDHMAYYAIEYREDGTGKTLVEDANFLISLRTSFMVSKVLGAMDNATDKRKITFNMEGQRGTNVEQIMDLLKDIYVSKHMYSLDQNPMNVMRELISRNVSIVPKNMEGVHDLDIQTETTQGQMSRPDDDIQQMLTDLIINYLIVPHNVLNELGENEFSRSVATSNIVFSNWIRSTQIPICNITATLLQAYSRNSFKIISSISDVLKNSEMNIAEEDVSKYIVYIINNIVVELPSPNISPDKARYEELRTLMDTIRDAVEKLMPEEMIVFQDEKIKAGFLALRADIVRRMVKAAISDLGGVNLMDPNILDNLDVESLTNMNQLAINYGSLFSQMEKTMIKDRQGEKDDSSDKW